MSWEKSNYTDTGAKLLAETLSGSILTITRAVSGTGTAEDLSDAVTVSGDVRDLNILAIETVTDGERSARKVSIQVTGADTSYIMHQIGVYARLNDEPESLLFLMQDERGIEVPAPGDAPDFELEVAVIIAISTDANIDIALNPHIQALANLVSSEIKTHNTSPDAHSGSYIIASERGAPGGVATLDELGILTESQLPEIDHYTQAETDTALTTAITGHDTSQAAHGDIRKTLSAVQAAVDLLNMQLSTDVSGNPFTVTFESLADMAVDGVWNATAGRIEF